MRMPLSKQRIATAFSKSRGTIKSKSSYKSNFHDSSPIARRLDSSRIPQPGAILQLQRICGNSAVQKMVQLSAIAPQLQEGIAKSSDAIEGASGRKTFVCERYAGDAQLENCLNDRDRLKAGDSGDSVRKVQQGLVDDGVALPQFGVDGKYGDETANAVKQFKAKHNLGLTQFGDIGPGTMAELDKSCGGVKPFPRPKPNPIPGPTPSNEQLEDTLDDIWLQHQLLMRQQDAGLARLETDLLSSPDKQTNIAVDALKVIVKTALGAMMGGGGSFLSDQIQTGLKKANMSDDDQKLVIDNGVTPIFDAAKSAIQDKSGEKVDEVLITKNNSVELFIDAQRNLLIDISGDAQEVFLTKTKPALRLPTVPASGGATIDEDPRVTRAKKYIQTIKKQRTSAFDQQYTESAQKFAVGQVQSTLKTKADESQGNREGSDLSKGRLETIDVDKLTGVVFVALELPEPNEPTKIDSVKVGGLSEKTRDRMLKLNPTLLQMGMPIIAEGSRGGFLFIGKTRIRVGRNENLTVFESGSNPAGIGYLEAKALNEKNELPPDVNVTADAQHGAEKVFDEIDKQTITKLDKA